MQKKNIKIPRKKQHITILEVKIEIIKNTQSGKINIIYGYGMNCFRIKNILKDQENSTIKNYCAYTDNNQQQIRKCDKGSF